jgi:starch synthase
MNNSKKLKILFVATEASPFAKAGGLGDMIFSLALALKKLGQEARIMIPRYGTISPEKYKLKTEVKNLKVPTEQPGSNPYLVCNVKKYSSKKLPVFYFLENMEYYEKRTNVYGYSDDHIRWILLCRGVLEFLKNSTWKPNIIVASDWQTGLIPNYLKTAYRQEPILSKIGVVFAIHNLQFQGMCDFKFIQETERDSGKEPIPDFFNPRLTKLNWLLRGAIYSDFITTVSPTYAKEILKPEYGEGLDKIFSENREKIQGILNGVSYEENNPEKSKHIPVNYNLRTIEKRKENKLALQKKFGLPQDNAAFLIAMVSRLAEQKGFDLLEKIIEPLLKNLPLQFIFLGDGESRYKEMIKKVSEKFPEKVKYIFQFDLNLPHLIFGGADALLMPSRFEPCGITQIQAMRYGCVPIVRKTGGLADTVEDFQARKKEGTGFVFTDYEPMDLFLTLARAYTCFTFRNDWKQLIKRVMKKDFSWKKSAKEYLALFEQLLRKKES